MQGHPQTPHFYLRIIDSELMVYCHVSKLYIQWNCLLFALTVSDYFSPLQLFRLKINK